MRATCLVLLTVGLIGCGKIDSTGSRPVTDNTAPPGARTPDTARPPVTGTDATARRDMTPASPTTGARTDTTTRADAEPDNTARNQRDTNRETREPKLPIDQKENQADIDTTAKIRQRVLKIDGLSVNGRNVKIVTADGKVTLRGPVQSEAERDEIAKIARDVAGDSNVDDQLEVKSASTSAPAPRSTTSPPGPAPSTTPPAASPPTATPNP
jgi:hypothetical protein